MLLENVEKWGVYPVNTMLNEAKPLFPRIELEADKEKQEEEYDKNLEDRKML